MNPNLPSSLSCLLLPLADRSLLLPNVAVAEVLRHASTPRAAAEGGKPMDGLLGLMDWRGLAIALLSFEAASGAAVPAGGQRIAVLNASSEQAQRKFFALLLQDHPRPLRLSAALAPAEQALNALELAAVTLADGQVGKIPDLGALEQKLLAAGWL